MEVVVDVQPDRKLRTSSLETLETFLSSRKSLTFSESQRLWKGLYYALWMTDRPLPQQALANELAHLLFTLRPSSAISWLQGFWSVMSMQWTDIDVLRMEKFLLLVRRVFAAQLRWVKERKYKGSEVEALETNVLKEWCFAEDGDLRRVHVGIRLHILDLWVDELERGGLLEDEAAQNFVKRMGEMVDRLKSCVVKPVRARANESYVDERLPWGTKAIDGDVVSDEDREDDNESWGGIDD